LYGIKIWIRDFVQTESVAHPDPASYAMSTGGSSPEGRVTGHEYGHTHLPPPPTPVPMNTLITRKPKYLVITKYTSSAHYYLSLLIYVASYSPSIAKVFQSSGT
jgi:hypothetical protein